jgi:two-component system OmpR family response regulator
MRILIVEDEDAMAAGLKFNFEQEGYEVLLAGDGPTGLELFQDADPPVDAVILDLMLPGMSGYETCTAIRSQDRLVPILVLSARTLSEDKMHAFDCGTDQFMTKPFALPELINRVKNLLERHRTLLHSQQTAARPADNVRQFDAITVNFTTYEVTVGEKTHNLTTLEMQLLKYFLDHAGKVLPRHEILENVWDPAAEVTTRTIDNFVVRLRRILEPDAARPKYILSVRGTGYRFMLPEKSER